MAKGRDPKKYVRENEDELIYIIKHSSDEFCRSLALAAILEYGPNPSIEAVKTELDSIAERRSD